MSIHQFLNSISTIHQRKNVNTFYGVSKHLFWQFRKLFQLFPFVQTISESSIIAEDKHCGVSALIHSSGMYDYNNMSLLKELMHRIEKPVFFDIGANIGAYSLIASEVSHAEVYAFEPHPLTYNRLVKNIKLNKCSNIFPVNQALDRESGEIHFANTQELATNHILRNSNNNQKSIVVSSIRGEEYCNLNSVVPNIVKLDVEGFEHDVLIGFGQLLSKIDLIFIEINGLSSLRTDSEKEIFQLLKSHNFLGPYMYNADQSIFNVYDQSSLEDPIFINQSYQQKYSFIHLSNQINN